MEGASSQSECSEQMDHLEDNVKAKSEDTTIISLENTMGVPEDYPAIVVEEGQKKQPQYVPTFVANTNKGKGLDKGVERLQTWPQFTHILILEKMRVKHPNI